MRTHPSGAARIGLLCTAACLTVAACSGSGGGGSASTTPTSSTTSTSPAASSAPATTKPASTTPSAASLAAIVLHQGEMPAGWKGTPYHADPSDSADQAALVACVGGRNTAPDKTAEANSDDFTLANATISSNATAYKSQADVASDAALLKSPKLQACYQTLLTRELRTTLPAGATIDKVTFKLLPRTTGEPANVAAQAAARINVTINGKSVKVYVNVAFITGKLIEAEVDSENLGSPVPAGLRNKLVALVAMRAAG